MYTSVLVSVNASHPETAVQALENFPGGWTQQASTTRSRGGGVKTIVHVHKHAFSRGSERMLPQKIFA